MMKLTKTLVEGAAPRAQRYRLNDSLVPGLCLLVLRYTAEGMPYRVFGHL